MGAKATGRACEAGEDYCTALGTAADSLSAVFRRQKSSIFEPRRSFTALACLIPIRFECSLCSAVGCAVSFLVCTTSMIKTDHFWLPSEVLCSRNGFLVTIECT